ncbi:hypothetical protein GCM10011415_42370 [Salipiger pallidus]|uniref:Sulfotransferase family protein n=1 Tax=Salipiger pallidus TaxID=1775170 RepID=A0A8J2ZNS3_9RHOB|nr:sulfotransferase family 2 domain-containing protein [Salipiger pallidus]GGG87339.1 hypothetical protein GCM10011415_42370 [Salipiger pallidus]
MIISPGRGYIFVHIPKTGGSSMAAALEARAHRDDILIGDTEKALRRRGRLRQLTPKGRLWKHSTLADIDGILSPAEIADMFTFTIVRNPWDRMVSYYHWLQAQTFDHPQVALSKQLSFGAFMANPATQAILGVAPFSSYMRDATGREHCSAWMRLEHFAEDMAPLKAHLGFTPDMGHRNRSARRADFRGYYDDKTAAVVAIACAEDIARFGYSFD